MGGVCSKCNNHPLLDAIKNFFFGDTCSSSSSSISRENSYDPEKARMEETIRINSILTTFRSKCEKISDKLEKDTLRASRSSLDSMVEFLRKINNKKFGNQKLNLNIEHLERENRATEDIINGYIKKHIQKRVSLDDEECLNILKMDEGPDKKKLMDDYLNSILCEAMAGLVKEIERSINRQMENVQNQIESRISSYEFLANDKLKAFAVTEKNKKFGEHKAESQLGIHALKIGLCILGKTVIEGE